MLLRIAELRKDFVKRAPLPVGEVAAPIKSYAPPPSNMQQANAAKGEGKVQFTLAVGSALAVLMYACGSLLHVKRTALNPRSADSAHMPEQKIGVESESQTSKLNPSVHCIGAHIADAAVLHLLSTPEVRLVCRFCGVILYR